MSRDIEQAVRDYAGGVRQEANAEVICKHYSDWVYNYLRGRKVGHATAEDLTQEILLKILHGIWRFRFECSVDTYVARIALNHWWKHLKRQKSHVSIDDPHIQEEQFKELEATDPLPQDELLTREEQKLLHLAILELPAKQRECVELFYYQERSIKDIAKILGKAVPTIGANLFFARQNLKKEIARCLYENRGTSDSSPTSGTDAPNEEDSCSKEM